jgi:hypothetical protein
MTEWKKSSSERALIPHSGDYKSFIEDMKNATLDYEHKDGKFEHQNPLKHLDLLEQNNFLDGIYSSWAAVLEVLSFYQRKIIPEGYLNSAVEPFSVHQLVSTIGYQAPHYLSAKTWLAFTLSNKSNREEYLIPKGTKTQNIPQGGKPAVFETIDNFIGKPNWNELTRQAEHATQSNLCLSTSASFCHINAQSKQPIKSDTHLWITGNINNTPVDYFVDISEVLKLKDGTMLIFWDKPLTTSTSDVINNAQIYWMPSQYQVFGFDVPAWNKLDLIAKTEQAHIFSSIATTNTAPKAWQYLKAYPNMTIQAMIQLTSGTLLAAGIDGIYASNNGGDSWQLLADKLANRDICCLLEHEQMIYAGGSNGNIICSYDEGQTWTQIRGSKPLDKEAKKIITPGLLPIVTIISLAAMTLEYNDGGVRHVILIGTKKGLFYSTDDGRYWHAGEKLFYSKYKKIMPEDAIIYHLQVNGDIVTASTNYGLYLATINHNNLEEIKGEEIKSKGPSLLSHLLPESAEKKKLARSNALAHVYASINVNTDEGSVTVYATDENIYQLIDNENIAFSEGIIRDAQFNIPKVNTFLVNKNDLIAATDQGVYITHNVGGTWQLISEIPFYTLPDPILWEKAFNNGELPEDLAQNLLLFGFPISASAKISTAPNKNGWIIEEPNCQPIHIEKNDQGGLTLFLKHQTLKLSPPTEIKEQVIGSIYPAQYYIDALSEITILPDIWHQLFIHAGVELSKKSGIVLQQKESLWLISDNTQKETFLIEYQENQLSINRLAGAKGLLAMADGNLMCGGDLLSSIPSNWPNFWLEGNVLPLACKTNTINVSSTLLLKQTTPRAIEKHVSVASIANKSVSEFGKIATVTQINTTTKELAQFDRRTAQVYAQNIELEVTQEIHTLHVPQCDGVFNMTAQVPNIPVGHKVAVVGQRAILQLSKAPLVGDSIPWLLEGLYKDGRTVELQRQQLFTIAIKSKTLLDGLTNNVFTAELFTQFLSHKQTLNDNAQLSCAGNNYWLITQTHGPYYYLFVDSVAKTIHVFREYNFPIIKEQKTGWIIRYKQELITLLNNDAIKTQWLAADHTSPKISEVVAVSQCTDLHHQYSAIEFNKTLEHIYDPTSMRFYANLVSAVHGETITHEVLGSIVQDKQLQRFKLRRSPLSVYQDEQGNAHNFLHIGIRRNAAPDGLSAIESTWQQTDEILKSSANDSHYEVIYDDQGKAEILFGDGKHGCIPKVGIENLLASYRVGGGSQGNLPTGVIKMLRSKPLGVKAVFNPVPSEGGAEPILFGSLRTKAPDLLVYNDLIISIGDCLRYAKQYPGVIQASLTQLTVLHKPTWVICIETTMSTTQEKQSLAQELALSIQTKLSQHINLKVVLARPRYFCITATIWLNDLAAWPAISEQLKHKISNYYLNLPNSLGKAADAAHLTAEIQSYADIAGVEITNMVFNNSTNTTYSMQSLPASPVILNEKHEVVGAELLLTNEALISINLGDAR